MTEHAAPHNNSKRWEWVLRVTLMLLVGLAGYSLKLIHDLDTRTAIIDAYITENKPTLRKTVAILQDLETRMSVTESNRFTSEDGAELRGQVDMLYRMMTNHTANGGR